MQLGEDQERLLTEIRDILREQLEEYRRVTSQSLDYQRRAVLRQEQFARLYRVVLVVGALLIAAFIWYLTKLSTGQ
jgi:type VI protein secretion system component VasF